MRLIICAAAWVLGISISRPLAWVEPSYWIALTIAVLCICVLLKGRLRWWLQLSLVAFAAGGFRQSLLPDSSDVAQYNGYSGALTGVVVAQPRLQADRIQMRVASERIFVNGKHHETSGLVLVEADRGVDIEYGDRIQASGQLVVPAAGDRFSYADYLARQGVFSLVRHAAVRVDESGQGNPLLSALSKLRKIIQRHIADALPEPQAGLLTGILLGDEDGISPALKDAFSRVGASHVVAISGFNMVVVSGIVVRALSGVFSQHRTVVTLNALSVIAVYSLLVGASPGILRAALMSGLLVVGSQLKRRTFVPTSLAFATLLLSLHDPNMLLDIGFQLSFLAVLGLGLFADPLSERFRQLLGRILPARAANTLHLLLNEPLIVSLAAQIATLPLIILYFGRLSLAALPVNLLIVPVQSAVLLVGMAATAAYAFLPELGRLVFWADLVFVSWTIAVVRAFADLPFAELVVDLDTRLIQAFYLLLIGGAMIRAARPPAWQRFQDFVRRNTTIVATSACALVMLALMAAMTLSRPDDDLHLWLLDAGHSNAALMQTPGGAQMLVDGGRYPTRLLTAIGDRLPFYDREIEVLVITHPDAWDIAALNSVLDRYKVGAALLQGQENYSDEYVSILGRLAQSGTPITRVRAGYRLQLSDGVLLEVLHPQTQPKITDRLNDHVIVLRISYGDTSILLTSDLSIESQRAMLAEGLPGHATVMQISQHGAARALDDDFVAAVRPQIALLQSDIANRRGDPDPDTLAKLRGARIFRTDEGGTIHLRTDGKAISVSQ